MASPTQMVVGKGIPNSLIAEGLLKILMDLVLSSPPKFLTNSRRGMVGPQKYLHSFSQRNEQRFLTLTVNY